MMMDEREGGRGGWDYTERGGTEKEEGVRGVRDRRQTEREGGRER